MKFSVEELFTNLWSSGFSVEENFTNSGFSILKYEMEEIFTRRKISLMDKPSEISEIFLVKMSSYTVIAIEMHTKLNHFMKKSYVISLVYISDLNA